MYQLQSNAKAVTTSSYKLTSTVNFRNDLVDRFTSYLDVKKNTEEGYLVCLKVFMNWMTDNGITDPVREDILSYKSYLESQNYTAGTKARYLRVVKQFFSWADMEGLYPNIALNIKGAKVRNDNTKKESFREEDIRQIIDSIERDTVKGKRNYAMLLLCVTGGLRMIELQRADIGDIQTVKGQKVLYIQGKGRDEKDEYIKLVPEVVEALSDYLSCRKDRKKNSPLFIGEGNRSGGARLTTPSLSRIFKTIFKDNGFDCDKLTAHSLRHTSNTLLFKAGADLFQVQQHARHSDPKTTEIYLHDIDREKDKSEEQIYKQIFHPSDMKQKEALKRAIEGLSEEESRKVLDFINSLK